MIFNHSYIQKKMAAVFILAVIAALLRISVAIAEPASKRIVLERLSEMQYRPGSSIMADLKQLPVPQRQEHLANLINHKHLPSHLRLFKPVRWTEYLDQKQSTHTVTIYVAPDYVSVGENPSVRVPLVPEAAQSIADKLDCILPTCKIVDQIYKVSTYKLQPQPFSPDLYNIESIAVWELSDTAINAQLEKLGAKHNGIVAGIKKDVVITKRLSEPLQPRRVAIYGWHKKDGTPIQPLSLVHRDRYVDYSHGIRLVSETMELDGNTTSIKSVLMHPVFADLLSYEGPLTTETISY